MLLLLLSSISPLQLMKKFDNIVNTKLGRTSGFSVGKLLLTPIFLKQLQQSFTLTLNKLSKLRSGFTAHVLMPLDLKWKFYGKPRCYFQLGSFFLFSIFSPAKYLRRDCLPVRSDTFGKALRKTLTLKSFAGVNFARGYDSLLLPNALRNLQINPDFNENNKKKVHAIASLTALHR